MNLSHAALMEVAEGDREGCIAAAQTVRAGHKMRRRGHLASAAHTTLFAALILFA